ncbi:MAG: hypothetical protein NZO58_00455 [Gemmataceae bacterium]|nr:hypothetical protein [Gemmataceae bacterium]
MSSWRWAIVPLFCCGSAPAVSAQEALAWRFVAGDSFEVAYCVEQTTALETKMKPFDQKTVLDLRSRWHVKASDNEAATLVITVVSLATKTTSGDGKAALPAKDDALWSGAEYTLRVDAAGRIKQLQGHDAVLRKLAGDSPQRWKILNALKPAETMQALWQTALGPLPDPAGAARWRHLSQDTMSIFGTFEHDTEFSRGTCREGVCLITGVVKTVYKAPRYALENDVFRVLKGQVAADEGKVEASFDAAKGRMSRVQRWQNLRGDLTIETLTGPQRVTFSSSTRTQIELR